MASIKISLSLTLEEKMIYFQSVCSKPMVFNAFTLLLTKTRYIHSRAQQNDNFHKLHNKLCSKTPETGLIEYKRFSRAMCNQPCWKNMQT